MLACLRYLSSLQGESKRAPAVPGVTATPVNSSTAGPSRGGTPPRAAADAPPAAKKIRPTVPPPRAGTGVLHDTNAERDHACLLNGLVRLDCLPVGVVGPAAVRSPYGPRVGLSATQENASDSCVPPRRATTGDSLENTAVLVSRYPLPTTVPDVRPHVLAAAIVDHIDLAPASVACDEAQRR